jgi:Recombination directionality factor-like
MIIKGLNKRFAEIGKIKIGCKGELKKSSTGKEFRQPKKYGYFVVTTTEKDNNGNFIIDQEIMKLLGEKPKEIAIRLPFDSIDLNFFTSFQLYEGNKCRCRGNGEKATFIEADGKSKEIDCKNGECQYLQEGKCKVSGILSCYLACKLELGGVYRFRTHGWNSVSNILSALLDFYDQTGGILLGMPLKLKMLKKSTEKHGNVDTVTVVLDNSKITEIIDFRQLALKEKESRKMLEFDVKKIENKAREDGFTKDTDDPKDVQEEFYPLSQDNTIPGEFQEEPIMDTDPIDIHEPVVDAKSEQNIKYNITSSNIWQYVNKIKNIDDKTNAAGLIKEVMKIKDKVAQNEALKPIIEILTTCLNKQGFKE